MARNGATSTAAHPDHFDPSKYGPDGEPVGHIQRGRGRPPKQPLEAPAPASRAGRRSKIRPGDVEQLLFLWQIVRVATDDLCEFLGERGYSDQQTRSKILRDLRRGWRPKR